MNKFLILVFMSFSVAMAQEEVLLYPDGAPGLIEGHGQLESDFTQNNDGTLRYRNVSAPSLRVYRPEKGKSNGSSVIICPGGGYYILAINKEGYAFGEWFAERGVTAFVLKYRLPQAEMFTRKYMRPLEDAQSAIKYVRENAGEYGLDESKVGIMGFSAGGHLASTASTHFKQGVGVNKDSKYSLRPDFSILAYPVISFRDVYGHMGSRQNLIGPEMKIKDIEHFSNELQVSGETPPAFLVHAYDDPVKMENSLEYVKALKANNIPAELHLFEKGGHGFGLAIGKEGPVSNWPDRLEEWLKSNNWMK